MYVSCMKKTLEKPEKTDNPIALATCLNTIFGAAGPHTSDQKIRQIIHLQLIVTFEDAAQQESVNNEEMFSVTIFRGKDL